MVARLEVRLDAFERSLKRAGVMADQSAKQIEKSFSDINIGRATAIGTAFGRVLEGAIDAVGRSIQGLIEKLKEFDSVAAATGLSLREAFALEKVIGSGAVAAVETVATQLDRMQRGEKNYLSKLFDANGIQAGKDAVQVFDQIRQIINDLQSTVQAREVGKAFGLSTEAVDNIRKAGDNFHRLKEGAAAAIPDVEHMNRLAKDFKEAWEGALEGIKSTFLTTFNGAKNIINDFVRDTATVLRALDFGPLFGRTGMLGRAAGTLEDLSRGGPAGESGRVRALAGVGQTAAATTAGGIDPSRRGAKVPALGGGGGGSAEADRISGVERFIEAQQKSTAEAQTQFDLLGRSNQQYQVALALTQAKEAAQRDVNRKLRESADLTTEEIARVTELASKREDVRRKLADTIALQNFAGNQLVDIIDRTVAGGEKLADVMRDVARMISRAALQAAILGQGPLAGLFGTSARAGGTGGRPARRRRRRPENISIRRHGAGLGAAARDRARRRGGDPARRGAARRRHWRHHVCAGDDHSRRRRRSAGAPARARRPRSPAYERRPGRRR